ncbi:MAG TPA: phosphotransferase [Planctomycetaceae bacterium]|nr:phosphotransferase [Planctomycetaceae bacterium]
MTPADLRSVLACYPTLSPWSIATESSHRPGFSGAGVVRVETALGPVAVRRWPAGWLPERLRGLHRLLAHIQRQGWEFVAVPFRTDTGDTLVEAAGAWWQVEPWLSGRADYHRQPSRQKLSAGMTALARWHLAASGFQPHPSESTWFRPTGSGICPATEERLHAIAKLSPPMIRDWQALALRNAPTDLRPFATQLGDGVIPRLSMVHGQLLSATTNSVPLQPCLRDVWHDHILYTGDVVTGLIDPSASRTDSVAVDLARLLGSLVEDHLADWRFALDEYARLRPLSLFEQRLIPILDRSGVVLSAVTWLKWLGPEARRWPDQTPIIDRLQRLTTRLESLANTVC